MRDTNWASDSPKHLHRLRELLVAAVRLPVGDQAEFLRLNCSDDEALLRELEQLLDVYATAGSFMSSPLPEMLGAHSERPQLQAGTLLKKRYCIRDERLQGGSASVYVATDETLDGMRVIVKVLDRVDWQGAKERFNAELKTLARVQHPNVVGVSDIGELEDGTPFLVLAFVPGTTLRHLIQKGPVPTKKASSILDGIARGLAATHSAGFIHLDLKPENVIVSEPDTEAPHATLLDFGVSSFRGTSKDASMPGTPNYMAPEQQDKPSAKCDIYAMSLIAFEMLKGDLPGGARRIEEQLPASITTQTGAAIAKGLSTDPARRFETPLEFLEAMRGESSAGSQRRRLSLAALVLVSLIAAYWFKIESQQPSYPAAHAAASTSAEEIQPAFSPDGEFLYYAVGLATNQDIYRKRLPNGTPELLAGRSVTERRPQVTPDGRFLIFLRGRDVTEIVRKNLSDGTEEVLAVATDVNTFTISPTGQTLLMDVVYQGSTQKIQVLDIASHALDLREILDPPGCAPFHPRISPDGKYLAIACRWNQGSHDLFVIPVNPTLTPIGAARKITNRSERIDGLEWTPDSRSLIYIAGTLGNGRLFRASVDSGRETTAVGIDASEIDSLAIARKSWRIAYSQDLTVFNIWRHSLKGKQLATPVVSQSKMNDEPMLSPDGKMLLFASGPSGNSQMWVSDSDGKHARQLTNFPPLDSITAIWSSDGTRVVVSVRSKELGQQVFERSLVGNPALKRLADDAAAVSMSRDGKWLYLAKGRGPARSIWRVPYGEAGPVELVADGAAVGFETMDGRRFCYAQRKEREGVWCFSLPDGKPKRVVERLHLRNLFSLGRDGIYYVAPTDSPSIQAIYYQGFHATGPEKLVVLKTGIGYGFGISPKEDFAYVSQIDVENYDIMVLDRFR